MKNLLTLLAIFLGLGLVNAQASKKDENILNKAIQEVNGKTIKQKGYYDFKIKSASFEDGFLFYITEYENYGDNKVSYRDIPWNEAGEITVENYEDNLSKIEIAFPLREMKIYVMKKDVEKVKNTIHKLINKK